MKPTGLWSQPYWDPNPSTLCLGIQTLPELLPRCACAQPCLMACRLAFPGGTPTLQGSFSAAPSPLLHCLSTTNTMFYTMCCSSSWFLTSFFFLIVGKAEVHVYHLPLISAKIGWIPQVKVENTLMLPLIISAQAVFGYQHYSSLKMMFSSAGSPINH